MCPVSRVTGEVPAFVQRDPQGVFHGTLAHPLGPRVSPCEPHVGRRSSLLPPLALSSDGRAAPSLLQQSAPARLPQALLCPLPVPAPRLEASALDTPRLSPGPLGGRCWRVSGSTWAALPTRWLPQSAASTPLVFLSSVLTAASILVLPRARLRATAGTSVSSISLLGRHLLFRINSSSTRSPKVL